MPTWPHLLTTAHATLAGFHQIPPSIRDELAQETLTRTLSAAHLDHPTAFTRRVARNLAIDWLRRRREEPLPDTEPGSTHWTTQTHARLDTARIFQLLDAAPVAYRDVLRRCFLEDEDVDTLIDEERQSGESRHRVQDRIYKRRARGLAWARRHLLAS